MHRLVVNPGTPSAWEIPLARGVTSIGSGRENSFPLEHASVSAAHCQVNVLSSGVLLKDLDSTTGTFVDDQRVTETVLLPGQTIRIGEVTMRFEAGDDWVAAPVITLPANASCKYHPKTPARFICPKCNVTVCDLCVNSRIVDGHPALMCRTCAVPCTPLPAPVEEVEEERSFIRELPGIFTYPFKGDGKVVMLAGTAIISIMDFVARHTSIIGMLVVLLSTGFVVCYMQQVLFSSASGEDEAPDLPDVSSFEDIAAPLLQFLGTVLICFGPNIVIGCLIISGHIHPFENAWVAWAVPLALVAGCILFPMAYTAVVMVNSLAGLNPWIIVRSILRIPLEYLLADVLFFVMFLVGGLGSGWLSSVIPVVILPTLISGFSTFYLLMIEMRMLGVLYWTKKDRLGWESES
jgi:FHA domain-containing protein